MSYRIADFVKELKDTSALLCERGSAAGGANVEDAVAVGMMTALCAKINSMKEFGASEGLQVRPHRR